jgi:hypothetical protein
MNARRCICPRRRRLKWLKPSTSRLGDEQTIGPSAATQCPRWVKLGLRAATELGLLCPQQRTNGDCIGMSVSCHERKSHMAPQSCASHSRTDHFSSQLFQHMRGLSPTSQFSPSGGAAGNAPAPAAEMPTRPSKALALAPLARCREVSWLVRAIAGVASEAAAISAADRSLSLVIKFLHGI